MIASLALHPLNTFVGFFVEREAAGQAAQGKKASKSSTTRRLKALGKFLAARLEKEQVLVLPKSLLDQAKKEDFFAQVDKLSLRSRLKSDARPNRYHIKFRVLRLGSPSS